MKICLVADKADDLSGKITGGSERQIALLARHLVERGNEVIFVVPGFGGIEKNIDGVILLSGWLPNKGIRWLRFFSYRLPNFKRVLNSVDAEVYYTRGGSFLKPIVFSVARKRRVLYMLGVASDKDLYPKSGKVLFAFGNSLLSSLVGPVIYRCFYWPAIRAADWIIVQNTQQMERCSRLGLPHMIIPSIVEMPPSNLLNLPEDIDVLWIGNITKSRRSKGFVELVQLVSMMPDIRFNIVGRLNSPEIQPLLTALRKKQNVYITGPLYYQDVLTAIATAKIVINTSPSEGFSNVMLEAWSLAKLTITLNVNPNNLLGQGKMGYCAGGDISAMATAIRRYLIDDDERRKVGKRCREYVASEHNSDKVCALYEKLFEERKKRAY